MQTRNAKYTIYLLIIKMIPDPNMAIIEHNNISDTNRKGLFGLTINLLEILLTGNITLKTLCARSCEQMD